MSEPDNTHAVTWTNRSTMTPADVIHDSLIDTFVGMYDTRAKIAIPNRKVELVAQATEFRRQGNDTHKFIHQFYLHRSNHSR